MKSVKIGSSIKVIRNNKEKFLTVEVSGGDICLYNKCTLVARRSYNGNSFTYNNETYQVRN